MRAGQTGELNFTIVVDATIDVVSSHCQLVVRRQRSGTAYSVVSPNEERAGNSASAIRTVCCIHSGTMNARTLVVSVSLAIACMDPSPNSRRYTS